MQITKIFRTGAYIAADILEHAPIGLCRSAASDLRYYARYGTSRYSGADRRLIHLGPVAVSKPMWRAAVGALADARDAWNDARNEIDISDSFTRAQRGAVPADR